MNRILVVDNYDSFTFNLVHMLENIADEDVDVFRSDVLMPENMVNYEYIIFSPGPGLPQESEALIGLIRQSLALDKKVLGVCLGHQALAVATGGRLKNLDQVHHGVSHTIKVEKTEPIFSFLSPQFNGGRYHSWVVDELKLSEEWEISCRDSDGEIMGINHRTKPVFGIQFHPESVLSPHGRIILSNFLKV